jgi:hypothetical protein
MAGKKAKVAVSCVSVVVYGAVKAQLDSFFTSAVNRGDWPVLYPASELNTGLDGSQNLCGAVEKGEISCSCQESNHDSSGHPADISY